MMHSMMKTSTSLGRSCLSGWFESTQLTVALTLF